MSEKSRKIHQIEENTLNEAEGFVAAANVLNQVEAEWDEQAEAIKVQARILTQTQNVMDNALGDAPFVPDKEDRPLFDEVNAVVEAANDIDNGWMEANRHHLKHLEEKDDPDEWNPETVIDEKIKEEQKDDVEQNLRNEIVDSFE